MMGHLPVTLREYYGFTLAFPNEATLAEEAVYTRAGGFETFQHQFHL